MLKFKLLLLLVVILALVSHGEGKKGKHSHSKGHSKEKHSHSKGHSKEKNSHSKGHSHSHSKSGSSSESVEEGRCQTKPGVIRGKVLKKFKTSFFSVCCDSCYEDKRCTNYSYNKYRNICVLRTSTKFVLWNNKNCKY